MAWFTTKQGKHVNTDWFDKDRQIQQSKQQADALNAESRKNDKRVALVEKMSERGFDKRYNEDIIKSADAVQSYFPGIREVRVVIPSDDMDRNVVAAMNPAIGILSINSRYINNYNELVNSCERMSNRRYHPTDASVQHQIIDHEMAHLADGALYNYLMDKAPDTYEEMTMPEKASEKVLAGYSRAMGREVKAGETLKIPSNDYDAKFLEIDGVKYSLNDFDGNQSMISNLIVPLAFKNIQANWKEIGFEKQPDEDDLLDMLGGYATWSKYNDNNYLAECFAEAYAEYQSYGMDSSVPTLEIMRLTFALYNSASKKKDGKTLAFYKALFAKGD